MAEDRDLAVALSGGGHRATVFALGALLALVDTGVNRRLRSVASVSGGSIANGVAMTGPDLASTSSAAFEAHITPALVAIADRGVLLGGVAEGASLPSRLIGWALRSAPATRRYLRALLAAALLAVLAVLVLVVAVIAHWWWLALGAAVVAALAGGVAWRLFRRRSAVTEHAIDQELLGGAGVTMGQVAGRASSVHHVICTTELQTGVSFFFTNRCVYGYGFGGAAVPPDLPLATAVQASACVPGAFAPRRLPLSRLGVAGEASLLVDDGGVYDNMADEWEYGFPTRVRNWPAVTGYQSERAGRLLLVNASAGWNATKPVGSSGVAEEVAGLMRAKDVQYDVSTAHRRRALHQLFRGADTDPDALDGLFAQISDSPYRAPRLFRQRPGHAPDDFSRRAEEARAFLDAQGYTEAHWDEAVKRTSGVATTLEALGADTTALLLEHGYVLTLVNLYVLEGIGELVPIDRERFTRLCRELPVRQGAVR